MIARCVPLSLIACSSLAIVSTAFADGVRYDVARVLESKPVYDTVQVPEGREVCRTEPVTYVESRPGRGASETSQVLGAIIGGVVGNQFGSGRGRTAATIGGVMLGSAIARDEGDRRSYRERRVTREERVCDWVEEYREESTLTGYEVRYDYKGTIGTTFMERAPGNTIRVQVAVSAAED